jgi:hypothetical protein
VKIQDFLFLSALSALSAVSSYLGCEKGDRLVLAKVDDRSITVADYRRMVEELRAEGDTTQTIDMTVKRRWLDTIVAREIVIHEGMRRGLDRSPAVVAGRKSYETGYLQEAIYAREVFPPIHISEADTRRYFSEQGYDREIRTSQIICETRTEADSLLRLLKAGADFAMIARDHSRHRPSGRQGGDMGFLREKMILPELRPILSSPIGKIHPRPLRSEFGYHIMKVTDRRTLDFESQREKISGILMSLKKKEHITVYLSSLEKRYHLSPNRATVRFLIEQSTRSPEKVPSVDSTVATRPLFTWTGGHLTIGDYLEYLRSLDPPSRPALTDTSAILRLGKDLSVGQILVAEARKKGYDRDPDIRQKLITKRDELIIDEFYRLEGGEREKVLSSLKARYAHRIVIYNDRLARVTL